MGNLSLKEQAQVFYSFTMQISLIQDEIVFMH
jgi:hypothetical protein